MKLSRANPAADAPSGPIDDLQACLQPGRFAESDHPRVQDYARQAAAGAGNLRERAVALYYAVRDDLPYNPYNIPTTPEGYRAHRVLEAGEGFCINKAILLAACARAQQIPARLAFADVRNHLNSERLTERMGTDLFIYHGVCELHIDGRWVKCTPAFNVGLCERAGIRPLEFDGREDSLFHPFDLAGRRHMEYVHDRGSYLEFPFEEAMAAFRAQYPRFYDSLGGSAGDFAAEARAGG